MIATSELRAIAKARLRDAQVLLRARRFDGAFYLCGYLVGTDNPALKAVLAAFSVDDGEVRVQKSNLFGLEIEDAIILRAKKPGLELPNTAMEPTART